MALIDWNVETLVNTTTVGGQGASGVVTLANGSYVVVWQDGSTGLPQVRFRISTPRASPSRAR